MIYRSLILLVLPLLFGCGQKDRFLLADVEEILLSETTEHYIAEVPKFLYDFGNGEFALLNELDDVFVFSFTDGKLKRLVSPEFDFDRFLREEVNTDPEVVPYDIEEDFMGYFKTQPLQNILGFTNNIDLLVSFNRIMNPIILGNAIQLGYATVLLKSDIAGNMKSYKRIFPYSIPKSMALVPYNGFYYNSDSNIFYSNSICEKRYETMVSAFGETDSGYVNIWNKGFPFPVELATSRYFFDVTKPNNYYTLAGFRKQGDKLYFLNGKDIYDFYSGNMVISANEFSMEDSIHYVESFVVLPKKDQTAAYFAYIEYVLPEPDAYDKSKSFLVVRRADDGSRVLRMPLSNNVSGLMYMDNHLAFIEMIKENFILKKYKVTYKL